MSRIKKISLLFIIILFQSCQSTTSLTSNAALIANLKEELKRLIEKKNSESNPSPTPQPSETNLPISMPTQVPIYIPTPAPSITPSPLSEETNKAVKDALDALFVVKSKVESGISYVNYSVEVATAKVSVDKMKRQNEYFRHASYASINSAMNHYDFAKVIWSCYAQDSSSGNSIIMGLCYKSFSSSLKNDYGAEDLKELLVPGMYLPDVLELIWQKGGVDLNKAQEKINKQPNM